MNVGKYVPGYEIVICGESSPTRPYDTIIFTLCSNIDALMASWLFLQREGILRRIYGDILIYGVYKISDIDIRNVYIKDKSIFTIGFCFGPSNNGYIIKWVKSMTVIDNSVVTKALMANIIDINTDESISAQTWKYLFGNSPMPWWIKYIYYNEDDRLIKEEYNVFHYAIRKLNMITRETFESFNNVSEDRFLEFGKYFMEARSPYVEEKIESAKLREFIGYNVYVVKSISMRIDIAKKLVKRPECAFVLVFSMNAYGNTTRFKVRIYTTIEKIKVIGINMGDIAKRFYGTGRILSGGFNLYTNIYEYLKKPKKDVIYSM